MSGILFFIFASCHPLINSLNTSLSMIHDAQFWFSQHAICIGRKLYPSAIGHKIIFLFSSAYPCSELACPLGMGDLKQVLVDGYLSNMVIIFCVCYHKLEIHTGILPCNDEREILLFLFCFKKGKKTEQKKTYMLS